MPSAFSRKDTIVSAVTAFCSPCVTFICCGLMVGLFSMLVVYSNINRNYTMRACSMVDPLYSCIQGSCYAKLEYVDRFGRERTVVNKRGESCQSVGEGNCYPQGDTFTCWVDQADPGFVVYGFNPETTKSQLVIGMISCGTLALAMLVIITTCFMCMVFMMQPAEEEFEVNSARQLMQQREKERQLRRVKTFEELIPTITIPKKGELDHDFRAICREKCTVCMDEFKRGDRFVALPCTHLFHKICVRDWLKQCKDISCPICRDNNIFEEVKELKENGIDLEHLYKQANLETASNITGPRSPLSPALYVPSPSTPGSAATSSTQRIQVKVPTPSSAVGTRSATSGRLGLSPKTLGVVTQHMSVATSGSVPYQKRCSSTKTPGRLPGLAPTPLSTRTPLSAPTFMRSPLNTAVTNRLSTNSQLTTTTGSAEESSTATSTTNTPTSAVTDQSVKGGVGTPEVTLTVPSILVSNSSPTSASTTGSQQNGMQQSPLTAISQ